MPTIRAPRLEVVPEVVISTPIEIWKEIIDHTLCDRVLFMHDPFYPGCNLHTALTEWNDTKRLRRGEVQRGTLRLVSRSWKALADSYRMKYFEPFLCEDETQQLANAQLACRLQLNPFCKSCWCIWECQCSKCNMCFNHMRGVDVGRKVICRKLAGGFLEAEILELPTWELGQTPTGTKPFQTYVAMPNLRALTVCGALNLARTPPEIYFNLVFLSFQVGKQGPKTPEIDIMPISTASQPNLLCLRTLRVELNDGSDWAAVRAWYMPSLLHLEISSNSSREDDSPAMYALISKHGTNLISLRLRISSNWIIIPDDIWSDLPRLEYLGTSTMRSRGSNQNRPPKNHPLRTLALLGSEDSMPTARSGLMHTIVQWKGLTTAADTHSWRDITPSQMRGRSVEAALAHSHIQPQCWKCIVGLEAICASANLSYVDCMGKTYSEFQAESADD